MTSTSEEMRGRDGTGQDMKGRGQDGRQRGIGNRGTGRHHAGLLLFTTSQWFPSSGIGLG